MTGGRKRGNRSVSVNSLWHGLLFGLALKKKKEKKSRKYATVPLVWLVCFLGIPCRSHRGSDEPQDFSHFDTVPEDAVANCYFCSSFVSCFRVSRSEQSHLSLTVRRLAFCCNIAMPDATAFCPPLPPPVSNPTVHRKRQCHVSVLSSHYLKVEMLQRQLSFQFSQTLQSGCDAGERYVSSGVETRRVQIHNEAVLLDLASYQVL